MTTKAHNFKDFEELNKLLKDNKDITQADLKLIEVFKSHFAETPFIFMRLNELLKVDDGAMCSAIVQLNGDPSLLVGLIKEVISNNDEVLELISAAFLDYASDHPERAKSIFEAYKKTRLKHDLMEELKKRESKKRQ